MCLIEIPGAVTARRRPKLADGFESDINAYQSIKVIRIATHIGRREIEGRGDEPIKFSHLNANTQTAC